MKIEISKAEGPVYIGFSKEKVAASQVIYEGPKKIIIDLDKDGGLVGIEIV